MISVFPTIRYRSSVIVIVPPGSYLVVTTLPSGLNSTVIVVNSGLFSITRLITFHFVTVSGIGCEKSCSLAAFLSCSLPMM